MGSRKHHLERADSEWENFVQHTSTLPPEAQPWRLTVAFYSALHYLEAYLHLKRDKGQADIPAEFDKHYQRLKAIRSCPELMQIRNPYRELQDISGQQRYVPTFQCTKTILQRAEENLQRIRGVLRAKLLA